MRSYSDIVPAERAGRWIKGQRGITRGITGKASAERSCCSIVSDRPQRNLQIIETVKQTLYGGVAQLGEHLPCKQGVKGSIPFISTSRQGRQTDGRIRAYELKSRFVAQVARARA